MVEECRDSTAIRACEDVWLPVWRASSLQQDHPAVFILDGLALPRGKDYEADSFV